MISQETWVSIQNGDIEARNKVWEEYQPAVEYIARKLAATLPKHLSIDDLLSAGQFGLLDAIKKFDPDRGFKFETYALTRIRGSMLDDLRSQDWVPRSVRQRDRNIDTALNELTHYFGRIPTDEEIAGYLEMDVSEVSKARAIQASNLVYNIDQPIDAEGSITVADSISSDIGDPSSIITLLDIDGVIDAIETLPEREKLTVVLHYSMDMTLAEIGRKFGVTESRVCQIHTKALQSIRQNIID
jgi:RNA polymerase sigma factor for flagellar operon FliA